MGIKLMQGKQSMQFKFDILHCGITYHIIKPMLFSIAQLLIKVKIINLLYVLT